MFTRHIKSRGMAQLMLLNADLLMFAAAIIGALAAAAYIAGV